MPSKGLADGLWGGAKDKWNYLDLPVWFRYLLCYLIIFAVFWVPYLLSNLIYGYWIAVVGIDALWSRAAGASLLTFWLVGLTVVMFYVLRGRLDRPSWRELGFRADGLHKQLLHAVLLVAAVELLEYMFWKFSFLIYIDTSVHRADPTIASIITAVIAAPLFEELVYRVNATTLMKREMGAAKAALIISVWFIAKHVFFWRFEEGIEWAGVFYVIGYSTFLWWLVSYRYLKEKSIIIPFFYHLYNNGLIALSYVFPEFVSYTRLAFIFGGVAVIAYYAVMFSLTYPNKMVRTGYARWVPIKGAPFPLHFLLISPSEVGKERITRFWKKALGQRSLALWAIAIAGGLFLVFTSEPLIYLGNIHGALCLSVGVLILMISGFAVLFMFLVKIMPPGNAKGTPWDIFNGMSLFKK